MIKDLKIYKFANKHKYKLIVGVATGIVIVTLSTTVLASCNSDDIRYTDYGVTKKSIKDISFLDTTINETEEITTLNSYKIDDNDYYKTSISPNTIEETTIITKTEPEESTIVYTTQKPLTEVVETTIKQTENITTEPSENTTNNDGYYIDKDGNYWNSYEEYKEYNDILNGGKVYTYR